ncbi:Mediator of ErbB2-driven cell motility-containing protein [Leptomonas seymouri]|uniref:Mediator of ErbB2-driven cell motility-containing protein n=1 Tax=Leptomonas seymouri TaxID=5684 RepID=A0A0N1IME1_LEPSE|nr:Mediator of ErbB2-driven cell motility-containing protein [Leptomonas seymouri]|eukprot:KPI90111.1 Mediator of ErbB2-driven cell motility-containing protein [Leptomonas seymouri]
MHSRVRQMIDPVGFATTAEQMDEVMARMKREAAAAHREDTIESVGLFAWRVAVCPHDDYTYVGCYYVNLLRHIKAKTVFLFGVAHKARLLNLENKAIFDAYDAWAMPYGPVKVSKLRDELMAELPKDVYEVHEEMQKIEHSIEAIVPFLQYYNRDVEIVPIVVPYVSFCRMEQIASSLGTSMANVASAHDMKWGTDFAVVISTDAVHYGDEDWGPGKQYCDFGVDQKGYEQAVQHEHKIINNCLVGALTAAKMKAFTEYTVSDEDFREYKWTWCGRYSVPCGLLTSLYLQEALMAPPLTGEFVSYGTSVDGREHIPVHDIGLGTTAIATLRHWVGYACVGYK